jgi:hypothetical protein
LRSLTNIQETNQRAGRSSRTLKERHMLKFIGGTIGLIFLIGLLVVVGLLMLIF